MKFETRPTTECEGWQLAHSIMLDSKRLKKTHLLNSNDVQVLANDGVANLQVFRLEDGDISETEAAMRAGRAIAGENLAVSDAGNGRANLVASVDGVFCSGGAIDALNRLDDAFSVASIQEHTSIFRGQLVATIKLVPYAVSASVFDKLAIVDKVTVRAFKAYTVALINSDPKFTQKTQATIAHRLNLTGGTLSTVTHCDHEEQTLTKQISIAAENHHDLILIMGASAISDTRDVVPTAVERAGGHITKLGLPTDPGNLLMMATLNGTPIIGLPGCAKSPALNGLDWVLQRLAAGLPTDHAVLSNLGVGGLLKEPKGRMLSRHGETTLEPTAEQTRSPKIAVVVLAAGKSQRSGTNHKLLSKIDGTPVIAKTVKTLNACFDSAPLVVTGFRSNEVESALTGLPHAISNNVDYADGMGNSLAHAARSIPNDIDWILVCLGDMPFISANTLKLMKESAQNASASVILPVFQGKRGHPVLWHKRHFMALAALAGDKGGKSIMQSEDVDVIEIETEDPGILIDLDTPEMLKHFGATLV